MPVTEAIHNSTNQGSREFMFRFDLKVLLRLIFCLLMFSTLLLGGCAPAELFYWGDYENSLYERYVENEMGHTEAQLQESFAYAESTNQRVPPGLYADYGFMLYKRGDKNGAINFFDKEKTLYPEASLLMTKLIDRVNQQKNSEQSKDFDFNKKNELTKSGDR